jgi:four helix bundle protein
VSGQTYRDLTVWQKAIDLVESLYRTTQGWPKEELYGLTNQAAPVRSTPALRAGGGRRAAVSVPANVAEGQGRHSPKEFLHYLSIAEGSLHEVETHLLISYRLRYIDETSCDALMDQTAGVGRLLHGLVRHLRAQLVH